MFMFTAEGHGYFFLELTVFIIFIWVNNSSNGLYAEKLLYTYW